LRQLRIPVIGLVLAAVLLGAAWAWAWEEPAHWARIGTVQQWLDLDARFYRTFDDSRFVDRSQFRLDQRKQYEKTRLYGGELPAVGIEEFRALDAAEQQRRTKLAAKRLEYVERFLRRVQDQVQRTRENLPSTLGENISDVTVIGDCLTSLGDAIGLDPGNPFAWHLNAFFSMCAGDEKRSRQYLDGATKVLDYLPADALPELRGRVALDLAWNQRGNGEYDLALANVDLAEKMTGPCMETRLLRGLIYARTGRQAEAGRIAASLRSVEVFQFSANRRAADFKPELKDPTTWKRKPSNYLAAWITSVALLTEGNRELARATFGSYARDDVYPLGWRFWNEAGLIYEMTGRSAEAISAWNSARINRPYLRNMVYKPYELALGVLTGHDARTPFILGYDRFYISGSRLAFGASMVGKVGSAETQEEKQKWALRALDELETCQRTGIYPGQASVLQGHVYYLLGDIPSTLAELAEAAELLEKYGHTEVQRAVLKDLAAIRKSQQASDVQSFFKQSGSSRGRWAADVDPVRREQELKARLEDDPQDQEAVLAMARFLIRHDRPSEGKELLLEHQENRDSVPGVSLMLEADRLLGETGLALSLVAKLKDGNTEPWDDVALWSLTGAICLDHGLDREATAALEHALQLDPGNQGLRMQLQLMGK